MTLGSIRVRWTANGEVVKDDTVPYTTTVQSLGDSVRIDDVGGQPLELAVEFSFDPPVGPEAPA